MTKRGWIMAATATLALVLVALSPDAALERAGQGLTLFLQVILPAQLPFLLCATLFMESGLVYRLGRGLEPVTRRLFKAPGQSAFAFLMGAITGYPAGARVTADLFPNGGDSNDVLRCGFLSSVSGPAYMLGAVGAGLLGAPVAGWLIALSHWGAVLLISALLPRGKAGSPPPAPATPPPGPRPWGEALGDAVRRGIETFWTVGGFIMMFSVVTGLLEHYGVLGALSGPLSWLLNALGVEGALAAPALMGLVEVTVGCQAAAQVAAPLMDKCLLMCALISVGGLSITMQQLVFLSPLGLPVGRFIALKCLHAAVAVLLCRLLALLPVFSAPASAFSSLPGFASSLASSGIFLTCGLVVMAACAFFPRKNPPRQ